MSHSGHRPKRSLGQNFLVDPNLQRAIVRAIDPSPEDEVLEIGPGRGALTEHLADAVGRLVLVELDDALAAELRERYQGWPRVEVVHEDILAVSLDALFEDLSRVKVMGNIPYNITTPILFSLLERSVIPAVIVLMVQREVGDRILAPVGSRAYGALSVGVRLVADVEPVLKVGRNAFRPRPDVESIVLRIRPRADRANPQVERAVRVVTREAFSRRRKQLRNTLRDAFGLSPESLAEISAATGIDFQRRPQTLSPEDFRLLAPHVVTPRSD